MAKSKSKRPRKPKAAKLPQIEVLPPEAKEEPKARRKPGRPKFEYTTEMGNLICEAISGQIPLVQFCKMEGMPSRDTVYRWLREEKQFFDNYARAREFRAMSRSDDIDSIIMDLRDGLIDPQVARVMIDAHKWQMSKENARLFGDKVALTDPDGGALVVKFAV